MSRLGRHRIVDGDEESEGHKFEWFGHHRFICDVLDDMRKCSDSHNYGPLKGLIEEAQVMANRMESALSDQRDLVKLNKAMSSARRAYKDLEREYKELQAQVKSLRPDPKKKS